MSACGIYARGVDVSEIESVIAAKEWHFLFKNNDCTTVTRAELMSSSVTGVTGYGL